MHIYSASYLPLPIQCWSLSLFIFLRDEQTEKIFQILKGKKENDYMAAREDPYSLNFLLTTVILKKICKKIKNIV